MKIIIMVFCLVIVLISAGCMQRRATGPVEVIEYHKGTQGLVMNFIKGLPPDEIWEGNEFIIGLELRNKGAEKIDGGVVKITGFDLEYTDVKESEKLISLEGKSPGYPEGDYMIVNFLEENKGVPSRGFAGFTVSAAYDYGTLANCIMCIDPDIFGISKTTDVCEVKPAVFSGGQGAPVAITKIDERISSHEDGLKVGFDIYISNKGNGKIVGGINIDAIKLSEQHIECNVEKFNLTGRDEKKIQCSAIVEKGIGARKVPLTVSLSYKYKMVLDKKIKIIGFDG